MQKLQDLKEGCQHITSYRFLKCYYLKQMHPIAKRNLLLTKRKKQGYALNLPLFFYAALATKKIRREQPNLLTRTAEGLVVYF